MRNHDKIEIDPEDWPKNYWESSLLCQPCEVHWPLNQHFLVCPQCETKTVANLTTPPDMRWPEAVKIFLEEKFEVYYRELKQEQASEALETFEKIVEAA